MGSIVSYLDYVYMDNTEGESLTSMTVCVGRTVTGTMVRRRCPSEDTKKKNERPLGGGSLTVITVIQDGPSWLRRSVTCVH